MAARLADVTASARSRPDFTCEPPGHGAEKDLGLTGNQLGIGRRTPLVGHVNHFGSGDMHKEFGGHMIGRTRPGRAVVEASRF